MPLAPRKEKRPGSKQAQPGNGTPQGEEMGLTCPRKWSEGGNVQKESNRLEENQSSNYNPGTNLGNA